MNWHSLSSRYKIVILIAIILISCLACYSIGYDAGDDNGLTNTQEQNIRNTPGSDINATDIWRFVNAERNKAGLNSLDFSPYIEASAMHKCTDMVQKDYWDHYAPDGTSPYAYMKELNISYTSAGENLAYGQDSAEMTVKQWMESPSHKAAILDESYDDTGIGVCHSPNFVGNGPQVVIVQHFAAN